MTAQSVFLPAGVEVKCDVKTPMRDGVLLSADIYFPRDEHGPLPVILTRTPYDNTQERIVAAGTFYAQHGYVYVGQDARGRFDSDGQFYPWVNEFNDGYDTIEWIGAQPWCNGNVGMQGASYLGNVQWQAAVTGSRYLKTIVPRVIGDDLHEAPHYQSGAFQLGLNATWALVMDGRTTQMIDNYSWPQLFATLPLRDLARSAGKDIPFLQDWIAHPDYDDYWKALSIRERYEQIKIPVLQISGWYDIFSAGIFRNFAGMRKRGGAELAREQQGVIMGPWVHTAPPRVGVPSVTHAGEVDFGMDSNIDVQDMELRWYDRWLKGIPNGVDREAPLRIFVMGANQWRDEYEWPPAGTRYTPFYLSSGGSANSLMGDGTLSTQPPADEPPDSFTYNPAFPAPTLGGCTCCNPEIVSWGAHDQRPVEYRSDVLVYTSEALAEDMEVTGPVVAKLHASTDARDTDFTAKLVDVRPDGYAVNLCDGIIRGRYRESTSYQKLLEPGATYELTIDLGPTCNVFKKGHRIRLDVSSSNFPRFDRNPNTGNRFGEDAEMQPAHQRIWHDEAHPSHIVLPLAPKSS